MVDTNSSDKQIQIIAQLSAKFGDGKKKKWSTFYANWPFGGIVALQKRRGIGLPQNGE